MERQHSTASGSASARRRLIRGAFSAPAALTLYSGSAYALPSGCMARQQATPVAQAPTANADTWMRVRAYKLSDSEWVKVDDVRNLINNANRINWTTSGNYICVNAGSVPGAFNGAWSNSPSTPGFTLETTPTGRYYALRFDTNGKVIGVVDINASAVTGSSSVTGSCWSSFTRANP